MSEYSECKRVKVNRYTSRFFYHFIKGKQLSGFSINCSVRAVPTQNGSTSRPFKGMNICSKGANFFKPR